MGKLRPTSSIAKLESAPSWDVEPTSPLPATATTNPPPPDSLATDPPQTDRTSGDPHEKTSTALPKSTIPSTSFTSHVEPQPSAPTLRHLDEIESVQAEVFPPAPPVAAATVPDNQIVPYVTLKSISNKQESGQNGHDTGPYKLPEGHVYSRGVAAGPAVPPHDKNFTPEAGVVAGSVARPTGLQPGGPPVILIPFVGNPWMSGLFDCCQHPTNAIITTVAPCVTFGQIAEILDNGSTSCLTGSAIYFFMILGFCHWNVGLQYRRRLRSAFKIAETPLSDQLSHICCPLCSLCQEFRELKYHGLDPSQGYQGVIAGILQEQRQGADTIPPAGQAMMK